MFKSYMQKISCKGRISRRGFRQYNFTLVCGTMGGISCLLLLVRAYIYILDENPPNRVVLYMFIAIGFMLPVFIFPAFISLLIRRLHDTGKSGWYLTLPLIFVILGALSKTLGPTLKPIVTLIGLVGGMSSFVYLYYLILFREGDPFENRYGPRALC